MPPSRAGNAGLAPPVTPRRRQHRRSRSLPQTPLTPVLEMDSFDHLVKQLRLGRDLQSIRKDRRYNPRRGQREHEDPEVEGHHNDEDSLEDEGITRASQGMIAW